VVAIHARHALPQSRLEASRAAVFLKEVGECFVGELLGVLHAVLGKLIECMPSLGISN
jgi:hypothetical protein